MYGEPVPGDGAAHIDAALFLGMHSCDDRIRIACKTFFVEHLTARLVMSLEEVGWCDSVIWAHPRELQDAYYPFMDHLHTVLDVCYEAYDMADIHEAFRADVPDRLVVRERLLLGMVTNRKGVLYTANPRLAGLAGARVQEVVPAAAPEPVFPEPLERLYRTSLALRLPSRAPRERR